MAVDQQLVLRALLADRTKLLAYIAAIMPDEHLAEDIFQEISLLAVRKHDQIQDDAHLMAWLRKAARLSALQVRRNQTRRPMLLDAVVLDALESHWDDNARESSSDRMDMLRKCMEKLNGYPRDLIELRYGEGISGTALAERVGRKLQTVYVALSRAHRSLINCVNRGLAMKGISHG
jgi:RNA polymerase sigma-70 factor (ECF subfamily)